MTRGRMRRELMRAMIRAFSGFPGRRTPMSGAWDQIAPGYDRTNTVTQMWLGDEGLRRAGLRAGMRFLDVAAGSGALSIPAARLGAQVLATDQSAVMLELLRARAEREGLEIETRVMDGEALDLEASTFDLAGSQFGVMLFDDMPRGIREMARIVKPGGRVLVSAYGDPREIEFLGVFVRAVKSVRPDFDGPPTDPPPLEFQLADPNRLRSELAAAGLQRVEVESVRESTEFKTGRELWDWIVFSNPIVEHLLGMLNVSGDERTIIQQTLEIIVRERADGRGAAKLTSPVNIGVGTK
jgi:SAM-dependent methyltransferase